REIIFEHQKDNVIEFNDIYRYITEHGKNTNTIESLDFINASSITLVSKDAPDVYTGFYAGTPDFSVISVSARQPAHPGQ
ncbi:MAG: hypothetical protein RL248_2144, partial [Pseudomonadota bacterium]